MKEIKVGAIVSYQERQGKQGILKGVVTRFDSKSGFYNVLWEDGYTSLMNNEETTSVLLTDEVYDMENTLNAIKGKDIKPEIEVGAVVSDVLCDGVITKIDNMYDEAFVLWSDGETSTETFEWVNEHLTGRKIKGLNEILDEIEGKGGN